MRYKSFICFIIIIGFANLSTFNVVLSQGKKIDVHNFSFIDYPGFVQQHSTWDDIGYNSFNNKVYVGVTNHHDKQMLYEYDCTNDRMDSIGLIQDLAHLTDFQWQGKIHTKFIEGPNGEMYFGTDGGESREEYLMDHPHGYGGGFFMKWDPKDKKLTNVGMVLQYESIKDVDIDKSTGILYGISYPMVHFLVFDPKTNERKDLGRLGSAHVPRVMFTDKWGNAYYVDWRQRLVKYETATKRMIFAKNSLPTEAHTPGGVLITGLTAYAKDEVNNIIYIITYAGRLVALHPSEIGIGRVEDLGQVIDDKDYDEGIEPWKAYTPDAAFGKNGKLYYFIGSEGRYAQEGKVLFVEYNPETRKKEVLMTFPLSEIGYVSGSDVTDKDGNMYFTAFSKHDQSGPDERHVFTIKFNPDKKLNK